MSTQETSGAGPSHRSFEVGIALLIIAFGAIVIAGSIGAGINWGAEGPRAGFFPFYIGMAIVISGAINVWSALRPDAANGIFAEWSQLRQVLRVVIPTAFYVASMPFIGLYLASMIFIGWFMRRLGKYGWFTVAAVAIGMPVLTYVIFEKWFLVPLPKGPVEDWLNL